MEGSLRVSKLQKGLECPSVNIWLWLKEQEKGWEACSITSTFVVHEGLDP